jgi:uncharacterized protein (TIGR00290 family)
MNVVLSWSGGKDSSLALHEIMKTEADLRGLLTTITKDYDRISMHGVRRELLRQQAVSLGLPLYEVSIPKDASNEIYEKETESVLLRLKKSNTITAVAFGDLFLQDIREYREKLLGRLELDCIFPIWGQDTKKLAYQFIQNGFRAIVCTVDPKKLDKRFCGAEFDGSFLSEIPDTVDPCGENGEFHTFVYDGPIFKDRLRISIGEIVERNGFYFADIIPVLEES